jgi:hypothetical protein
VSDPSNENVGRKLGREDEEEYRMRRRRRAMGWPKN